MSELIITAAGPDRPGIVAAVTGALYEHGANLADCAMALLGGQFAMMLLVESEVDAKTMESSLTATAESFELEVTVREAAITEAEEPARPYVVSVYGADHPGIVHGIASVLARRSVNITDLTSHLMGGIYTMVLDVELPPEIDPGEVEADLLDAANELGVDHAFRPADADAL